MERCKKILTLSSIFDPLYARKWGWGVFEDVIGRVNEGAKVSGAMKSLWKVRGLGCAKCVIWGRDMRSKGDGK